MRKLLHYLFGWHYIAVEYGSNTYICRVRSYIVDTKYIKLCGSHYYLNNNGTFTNLTNHYIPLTWKLNDD